MGGSPLPSLPLDSDSPLDWRPDGSAVVIVTTPDVDVQVVDETGRTAAEATIPDGDYTISVYDVDAETGEYELLGTLELTDKWLTSLGDVSGGRGMVARIETFDSALYPRSAPLTLIPLDGSPRRVLPALRAPAGTRLGFTAAVGSRAAARERGSQAGSREASSPGTSHSRRTSR